VKRDLIFLIHC